MIKVINQLFNYPAAPGEKKQTSGTTTQSPSKGALPLPSVLSHRGRGMASTEPWCPPDRMPQHPGGREDHPLPKRAGAENRE